jgi:hypothetical protein
VLDRIGDPIDSGRISDERHTEIDTNGFLHGRLRDQEPESLDRVLLSRLEP